MRVKVIYRLVIGLYLILAAATSVTAQDRYDDQPAPEFVYRDGNHLVMVNGYTGEAVTLPLKIGEEDRFSWSPDGRYLLAQTPVPETYRYCINLYDVDAGTWANESPIACDVVAVRLHEDMTHLLYTTNDDLNGALWRFDLHNDTNQILYETNQILYETNSTLLPSGVSILDWSPTGTYLYCQVSIWVMGGTENALMVMNTNTWEHVTVYPPSGYYASYSPIWSEDDRWFLIILKEDYVYRGHPTNDQGDVYLVNSETGAKYRLTYTPADSEYNVRWTKDGGIAYSIAYMVTEDYAFSIEEAQRIEETPREDIITPEPVNIDEYAYDPSDNAFVSPDGVIGAWVEEVTDPECACEFTFELHIGVHIDNIWNPGHKETHYTISLPNLNSYWSEPDGKILIGWRPSDFPYAIG